MLGIRKYELNFLNNFEDVLRCHKQTFNHLIEKSIDSYYVQWDINENNWNQDGPIILMIDKKQYEFTAFQLDYSLTINKINLSNKLNWYESGDDMPLEWKKEPFDCINSILNRRIAKIYALEFGLGENFNIVGFEFEFEGTKDCLHISNGLDCNQMKLYKTLPDKQNKRIEIK